MPPIDPAKIMQEAVRHHKAGRLIEAEQLYCQVLDSQPDHANALHLLGALLFQKCEHKVGIRLVRRAIDLNPAVADYHANLASMLGQGGMVVEAIGECRKALVLSPNDPQTYFHLGILLESVERLDEADAAYRQSIALRPDFAAAYNNLGNVLHTLGRFAEAEVAYRESLQFRPSDVKTIKNIARALHHQGRLGEAAAEYHRALVLSPIDSDTYNSLGTVRASQHRYDQAIPLYQRALASEPDTPVVIRNLGNAMKEVGRLDEAIEQFRRAMTAGEDARSGDCLLLAIQMHPDYGPRRILDEHQKWEEEFAKKLAPMGSFYPNDRSSERRLRIGYVSPQFCDQIIGRCVLPLLENHDHRAFEIVCYSDAPRTDAITERLRRCADLWRNVIGISDERLCAQIREDQIDILIDLALHTERNRLLVFARKPAPVQVTWIGYPGTTGLKTVDYRVSDPYLDPVDPQGESEKQTYSEQTVRLPNSFWCYEPLDDVPEPGELPALTNVYVTFGCLNAFGKVTHATLEHWAAALRAVPNSRLLVLAPEGSARELVCRVLGDRGIERNRVEFVAREPQRKYFELYHRIDIGLDTHPYTGHTTTLDSLWMGVPVVSLPGKTAVSRGSLSILSNVGLAELCASTAEQVAHIAGRLAGDLPKLAELRRSLRERMAASPLMDAPQFARDIESLYRGMWREHCKADRSQPARRFGGKAPFHIMIVEPSNCPYTPGFHDLARLLELSLQDLGHPVSVASNTDNPNAINLVLAYQLLESPPRGYWIPYQLEQLSVEGRRTAPWLEMLARAQEIWDYDVGNIEFLRSRGIHPPKHVPVGFHRSLRTIPHHACDIDVLHYGFLSERRRVVVSALAGRCRVQHLFRIYGAARDEYVARSKIVLNIHSYAAAICEQVRISYPLNNGRCVVTEESAYNPYREMAVSVPYEQLVERCLELLANDAERERIAAEGAKKFEAMPMTEILANAIRVKEPSK